MGLDGMGLDGMRRGGMIMCLFLVLTWSAEAEDEQLLRSALWSYVRNSHSTVWIYIVAHRIYVEAACSLWRLRGMLFEVGVS